MKNVDQWKPSKFVQRKGKLRASRQRDEVVISSRLVVDVVAGFYQENIPLHFSGKLLDLGCGKVPFYAAYKNYVTENVCVDWGNTIHKNPYLDIITDINQPLSIVSESFNTVLLSDVLEHIRKPENLIAEVYRLLLPEGKFVLNVPFFYWIHEQPFDYYRYTKFALEEMLVDAGFKIVKIEELGGAPEVLVDVFCKNALAIPIIGRSLVWLIQNITMVFLKTGLGKKISKKTSQKFPMGYFVVAQK